MNDYQPKLTEQVTNLAIKGITAALCRVEAGQLSHVPAQGPLIIVTNHVNFLEVPVIYTRLTPRPMTAFAKIETWDSAFLGWLFDVWDIIPIRRGEPDKTAVKRGLQALKDGYILTISPEGTRSNDGRLLRGHPGVVMIALLSDAPLLPLVHYGHENYQQSLRRFRRSDFHTVVGHPFTLDKCNEKVTKEVRQKMVDEIMYQLAALLPPDYRGEYTDISKATEQYLRFTPPARSNLLKDPGSIQV
jgi:1-acyl-sn-glycerol-3-phosphate acyltransferase